MLDELLSKRIDVVLLDRTPLIDGPKDRITVQRISKRIYPAWFFSRERLLRAFEGRYRLVEEFAGADRVNIAESSFRGFLFERVPG